MANRRLCDECVCVCVCVCVGGGGAHKTEECTMILDLT